MLHYALIDVWNLFRQKLFCLENLSLAGNVGGSGGSSSVPVRYRLRRRIPSRVSRSKIRPGAQQCLGPDVSVSNTAHISKLYSHVVKGVSVQKVDVPS
jgi:hypothetical protein